MISKIIQGQASEWALLRRHSSEDFFGVQICGAFPDTVTRTIELIEEHCTVDFIDINMGCPIDIVCNKGAGSALLTKPMRMKSVVEASSTAVSTPVTIKVFPILAALILFCLIETGAIKFQNLVNNITFASPGPNGLL